MGLEHCPNGELFRQLEARGALPLEDARQWAAEVVDILDYLRRREVIHRCAKLLTACCCSVKGTGGEGSGRGVPALARSAQQMALEWAPSINTASAHNPTQTKQPNNQTTTNNNEQSTTNQS